MNKTDIKYQGALKIINHLREKGFTAYFVGGCVRDLVMNKEPKDYDIATDALADETEKLFKKTRTVGKQFGVMLVIMDNIPYEVATFRMDAGYSDGRHPDSVIFGTAEMDALRRDFTVNGLFFDPVEDKIIDLVDGSRDIHGRIIKAIGDPDKRFEEDKLRMLRAVRFASTLEFEIEKKTWEAIQKKSSDICAVSNERIRDELIKILIGPHASTGLKLLLESHLLREILPEVEALVPVKQPSQFHPTPNAFEHTRLLFDFLEDPSPRLAMAALLHDIGKAKTMTYSDRIRFNNHDNVGAAMAETILKRLRFSNGDMRFILRYIKNHMKFIAVQNMRESTLKKFLGQDLFHEELELHRADCMASHKNIENYDFCREKLEKFPPKEILPDHKVTGKDLLSLGYVPGPVFKEILDFAYNEQLENKELTKEMLLQKIQEKFSMA